MKDKIMIFQSNAEIKLITLDSFNQLTAKNITNMLSGWTFVGMYDDNGSGIIFN